MTFTPLIPSSGVAGWNFLQSTYDRQYDAFVKSGQLKSDSEYFVENIGKVKNSDDLLNDRRLLQVAVKAFGLEEEINYRALLQRALNEGTSASDALANQMNDERYVRFSDAFGFGPGASVQTTNAKSMQAIVDSFQQASFEEAVGDVDETMRTALFAKRAMVEIFGEPDEDDRSNMSLREQALADFNEVLDGLEEGDDDDPEVLSIEEKWQDILQQDVLTEFFSTALRITQSTAALSEDEAVALFRERATVLFGTDDPIQFFQGENRASVLTSYRSRAAVNGDASSDIAKTAELSGKILDQMIARDISLTQDWEFILDQEPLVEVMKVTLSMPSDIDDRPRAEAIGLYREQAIKIFGTDDPNVFADESMLEATMELYRESALAANIPVSEINSNAAIAETIFKFSFSEDDIVDAGEEGVEAEINAGWYSIMGQTGLPRVFNTIFELDADFSTKTIEEQLEIYKTKAEEVFGTSDPDAFTGEYSLEGVTNAYRDKATARGDSDFIIDYTINIATRELNNLFQRQRIDEDAAFEEALEQLRAMSEDDEGPSVNSKWYTIMGQEALTSFMLGALGLPEAVRQLDIDQALEVYKRKAEQVMGSDDPADFVDSENLDRMVDLYLTRSQLTGGSSSGYSSGNTALMLLR